MTLSSCLAAFSCQLLTEKHISRLLTLLSYMTEIKRDLQEQGMTVDYMFRSFANIVGIFIELAALWLFKGVNEIERKISTFISQEEGVDEHNKLVR
ncbi:hypothetical protein Sjap_004604 [Stephania japonica]|uniref:Uncharacterized protein n=1 Tax=Stephania japonica TaxID=461633 RepID=A0AAP0PL25_9MAGN